MRTSRKVAAALAGVGLAVTAGGVATAATASADSPTTPTCLTSGLRASAQQDPTLDGMGHEGVMLSLTNVSGHTCALRGYPGLSLENRDGTMLPSTTHRGGVSAVVNPGTRTIFLTPGESAHAAIAWTDAGSSSAPSHLAIIPPANTTHLVIPFTAPVDGGTLDVTAFAHTISTS